MPEFEVEVKSTYHLFATDEQEAERRVRSSVSSAGIFVGKPAQVVILGVDQLAMAGLPEGMPAADSTTDWSDDGHELIIQLTDEGLKWQVYCPHSGISDAYCSIGFDRWSHDQPQEDFHCFVAITLIEVDYLEQGLKASWRGGSLSLGSPMRLQWRRRFSLYEQEPEESYWTLEIKPAGDLWALRHMLRMHDLEGLELHLKGQTHKEVERFIDIAESLQRDEPEVLDWWFEQRQKPNYPNFLVTLLDRIRHGEAEAGDG